MARDCSGFRTALAEQTPFYDKAFLKTYMPLETDVVGRHITGVWEPGTSDTHYVDRLDVGFPNLNTRWQQISSTNCGTDSCAPPRVFVAMGSVRSNYYDWQLDLQSTTFCLTQLLHQTRPGEQIKEWMMGLKKLPLMHMDDFIRVMAAMYADNIQIAGNGFTTLTPNPGAGGNIAGMLTTINLGSTVALPQSQLTWPYLNRLCARLMLAGYGDGSGLPSMMYNLIVDERAWFKLTNGNSEIRAYSALDNFRKASPLYKIGEGIDVPFGNIAPTLSKTPIRFQHIGSGVLNRVYPYTNVAGTTGTVRQINEAYIKARYGMSFLWHPQAIKILSPPGGRMHDLVPTINSSMFGKWHLVNPIQTNFQVTDANGNSCTYNNDEGLYFYWKCKMVQAFQYRQQNLLMPIIHQIDGSGEDCMTNDPVCSSVEYVAQTYSDNPTYCDL